MTVEREREDLGDLSVRLVHARNVCEAFGPPRAADIDVYERMLGEWRALAERIGDHTALQLEVIATRHAARIADLRRKVG